MDQAVYLVIMGSILGGLSRFFVQKMFASYESAFPWGATFPWAIFVINIIGCFLVGFGLVLVTSVQDKFVMTLNYMFITGFCGSFTTFSTFTNQGLELLQAGEIITSIFYINLSIFLGLISAFLGQRAGLLFI